ncbi:MAG: hypothetical protein FWC49_06965 [Proteobacteria bacterium]|nr:hypothetical protein [Pseudomonadota bacterium]
MNGIRLPLYKKSRQKNGINSCFFAGLFSGSPGDETPSLLSMLFVSWLSHFFPCSPQKHVPKNLEQIFTRSFPKKINTLLGGCNLFFHVRPKTGAPVHFSNKIVFPVQVE